METPLLRAAAGGEVAMVRALLVSAHEIESVPIFLQNIATAIVLPKNAYVPAAGYKCGTLVVILKWKVRCTGTRAGCLDEKCQETFPFHSGRGGGTGGSG